MRKYYVDTTPVNQEGHDVHWSDHCLGIYDTLQEAHEAIAEDLAFWKLLNQGRLPKQRAYEIYYEIFTAEASSDDAFEWASDEVERVEKRIVKVD